MKQKNILEPVDPTTDLINKFQQAQSKNETVEILKELFDTGKIHMITDLTGDEIKIITALLTIARIKKIKVYEDIVYDYCKLVLSKKRSSRNEIIKSLIGLNSIKRSMLNPMNWGRRDI